MCLTQKCIFPLEISGNKMVTMADVSLLAVLRPRVTRLLVRVEGLSEGLWVDRTVPVSFISEVLQCMQYSI